MTRDQYFKYQREKRIRKGLIISAVAIVVLVLFLLSLWLIKPWNIWAAPAESGVAANNEIPLETGTKGTATNPFVILEIVPYEGFAEIGYLIDGCEPVDVNNVDLLKGEITTIGSFGGAVVEGPFEQKKFELEASDVASQWEYISSNMTMPGYYEKVASGSGSFVQEVTSYEYKEVGAGKGSYKKADKYTKKEGWESDDNYFASFVYDTTTTGVQRYKVTSAEKPSDTWYYAYYDRDTNENYIFNEKGTGTFNVIFTAADDGDYILQKGEKVIYEEQKKYANYGRQDTYLKVDGGGYARTIKDASYTKKAGGDFKWVTVENLDLTTFKTDHNVSNIGDKVYTTRTDKYYRRYQYTYKNKNLFLKKALHLTDEQIKDYHVVVKTIQPSVLNKNLGWINRADLIYLNPKTHMSGLPELWAKYNRNGTKAPTNYTKNFTGTEELSWEAALAIFKKVVVAEDYSGIIIDATAYDSVSSVYTNKSVNTYQFGKDKDGNETKYKNNASTGYLNNVYKLSVMLRSMNPVIFYNLYLNDYNGTVTPLISQTTINGTTTGNYAKQPETDARTYWSSWTFLPTKENGTQAQYADWLTMWDTWRLNPDMAGNVSVMNHIYTYNGDNSLTFAFNNGTIANDGKFTKELYDYLVKNGGNSPGTPADAVDYIIGNMTGYVPKRDIKVLDIEPDKNFTLKPKDVGDMLLVFIGNITIEQQTSASFIGKIEDLNKEYDLIYMGLNNGALNLNTAKTTVYNDSNLNGKIYLHVGDKVQSTVTGIESVNWGSTITGANATEKVGNTTYNLLRLPGNDITALKSADLTNFLEAGYPIIMEDNFLSGNSINSTYIDKTSNIAEFVSKEKGRSNFFTRSGTKSNKAALIASISASKPQIRLVSQPVAYNIGVDAKPEALKDSKYYINGKDSSNRSLSFQFQIIDEGDKEAKYVAEIFVDANADGKFANEEKQKQGVFTAGGTTYTISKTLHEAFFGVIPWKLMVYKVSDANVRTEVIGYSAVMKNNSEKQTIKVLQINQNPYTGSTKSNLNLQTDSVFQYYAGNLNDFKVDFTTITISEYSKLFDTTLNNAAPSNPKVKDSITKKYSKSDAATDRLADFDMVILGFADCYDNISNTQGELDNLAAYVTAGKSVLCTHDVTSFNNVANNYGYNFNIYFRDMLGMDRFGVRTSTALVKDDAAKDKTSSPYTTASSTTSYSGTQQGYTYYAAMRLSSSSNSYGAYNGIKKGDAGNRVTNSVNKLNNGQLTMYPYNIKDTFTVADTHAQYYQLNLEDPDIVVWYTLASGGSNPDDMYGVSPYDASNNYYIYNKGNITYTGMGHSAITSSNPEYNKDEVKLFINTFVAAYKAGLKAPAITVKDAIKSGENQYTKYSDLDPNATELPAGEVQRVEFSVTDFNFVSAAYDNDDLGVLVTLEDGTPLKVYAVSNQAEVKDTVAQFDNPSKLLTRLKNETSYYVLYPMDKFVSGESKQVKFYAENHIGLNAAATVNFVQRTLFNLD